jgi:putative metallohydrolase (TIGR04338 family)
MSLVIKFEPGLRPVIKHQEHDQKTHGNWATGVTSELSGWSPKDKVPDAPRNATGTTDKFWENWEHGVDGDQFVDLYRQYAGEMLGLPVPKSDKDVGGSENYLTQRGFGASSTGAVRNQTEAVLTAIANGRPQPTLYRGMAAGDAESKALLEQFTNLKEGDTIDMPLVSTTRSLGVAQWYAADRSYTPSDTKVILKIQEGAKGVSVNRDKSFYPSDFETITSGKFEVVGITTVTVPYWARGAVHARTFKLSRPGEDLVTGYRFQDPKDLSWDRLDSNDPAAKVRYEIIRDGANTGNFSKIETPTLKYTNDRQPSGVKDGQDITVNSWTQKPPTTFTIIEVKMIEPHTLKKGVELGMVFHSLFNTIPFIRDEEDVMKHQEHDQSSHGNWADSGSPKLTIIGKNDGANEFFNENTRVVRYQPEGEKPTDYVLYTPDKSSVYALVKPTDGTTIDGWSTGITDRKAIAILLATGPKATAFRSSAKDDNKGTITNMNTFMAHRRRGLASAMLRFHRDIYPELDIQHSHALSEDGKAWSDVAKHQEHDQSTHGNWATGQKGGSGLSHREMFELKKQPDPLVSKVYAAEEKNHNQIQDIHIEQPSAPNRADFTEYADYDKAYKQYSKDFTKWSRKVTTSIISPIGEKHLDGTPRGVNGYVRDVISQDWFVEAFGKGGAAGSNLDVFVSSANEAGAYQIGFKNEIPVSNLRIGRGYTKAEPTIVHEIAHYATTISATSPHGGHGVEFARNHIFIAGKVMGQSFADGLETAYREAGVPLGD